MASFSKLLFCYLSPFFKVFYVPNSRPSIASVCKGLLEITTSALGTLYDTGKLIIDLDFRRMDATFLLFKLKAYTNKTRANMWPIG